MFVDYIGYGNLIKDDRLNVTNLNNIGSDLSDICSQSSPDLPSSPLNHRTIIGHHHHHHHTHSSEDLYSWMAKQDTTDTTNASRRNSLRGCMESKIDTSLLTDQSHNIMIGGDCHHQNHQNNNNMNTHINNNNNNTKDNTNHQNNINNSSGGGVGELSWGYPIQYDSVRLLDANQIFQPLLSGLGVMPQQLRFTTMSDSTQSGCGGDGDGGVVNEVTTLDALGSNFCLVGNMETMRIDIVVSEHGKAAAEKKKTNTNTSKNTGKGKQRLLIDVNNIGKYRDINI